MSMTVGELLALPKRVTPPGRRRRKSQPTHRAWDLALEVDSNLDVTLVAFIRISIDLPESFSIGLRCHPEAGSPTVLLRVNGDHGEHRNPDGSRFPYGSHVHAPLALDLDRPVASVDWPQGPPAATLITPTIVRLTEGWQVFSARATIANTPQILGIVEKMASGDEQMELF